MNEMTVLMQFLSCSLEDSLPVLRPFAELEGAKAVFDGGKKNFVYVPGKRNDRVVLVAHTDTVWDRYYTQEEEIDLESDQPKEHRPVLMPDGTIRQGGWRGWGLGADDRAGCAMLWLLRNSGHSLLLTDGEEHGQIGAHHLMTEYPEIAGELNDHRYMIQLDRRNETDYKTYALPVSRKFLKHIEKKTAFRNAGKNSRTDIVALCTRICGINLSVGYFDEHCPTEYLHYNGWLNTCQAVQRMLENEQPLFLMKK